MHVHTVICTSNMLLVSHAALEPGRQAKPILDIYRFSASQRPQIAAQQSDIRGNRSGVRMGLFS